MTQTDTAVMISADEMITKAYELLCSKHKASSIDFSEPSPAYSSVEFELREGGNPREIRIDYNNAQYFEHNGCLWVVANGMPRNRCDSDYGSDILCYKFSPFVKFTSEEIRDKMKNSTHFRNSILFSRKNGALFAHPYSELGRELSRVSRLRINIPRLYNSSLACDFRDYPYEIRSHFGRLRCAGYSKQDAEELADSIDRILK